MPNLPPIQIILVPQGSEYKAVCRGLSRVTGSTPLVVPIPVGSKPLTRYLQQQQDEYWLHPQSNVLVMGLCGSLTPRYPLGEIVLYQDCVYQMNSAIPWRQTCDRTLTAQLQLHLKAKVSTVKALTSDRLIWSAAEKRHLAQVLSTDVVDMEGFAALELLKQAGVAVAMLRVVSDDCYYDLPDLNPAISADGSLAPLPLAFGLLRQPIAATRLVRGALQGLKVLEQVTKLLFSS